MQWQNRYLLLSPVYYGVCFSEEEFYKELKRLNIPKVDYPDFLSLGAGGAVHALVNEKGEECNIVCLNINTDHNLAEVIGIITHECVHLYQHYLSKIGEANPGKEIEAYCIQSYTSRIVSEYLKTEQGKKKMRHESRSKRAVKK